MRRFWTLLAAVPSALLAVSGTQAVAQANAALDSPNFGPFLESNIPFDFKRGRNVGVLDRDRPEYEPVGINAGSFTALPRLTLGTGYSDNIDGGTLNRNGAAFFTIDPDILVRSNWSRHELTAGAGAGIRRFVGYSRRDQNALHANVDGRLDIFDSSFVIASFSARRAYEAQYSGSFPANAVQPIEYSDVAGLTRGVFESGRFRLTGAADVHSLRYDDTRGLNDRVISQRFRDRDVIRGSGRVEYQLTPATAAFVQFTYARSNYDYDLAGFNDNRDGDEIRALAGATFDLTALIRATIGVGYLRRTFDSPRFQNLGGFAYDVRVQYFMSELTTVSLSARRSIEDAIVSNASGYFANALEARVDHELLRDVLLFGQVDYERDVFRGIDRRDRLITGALGGRYLFNRHVAFGAVASHVDRTSHGVDLGQIFHETRGTLSVSFQY